MRHSADSRHEDDAYRRRVHDVEAGARTAVCVDQGQFSSSSWSLEHLPPTMNQSTYGCYDPPSTPAAAAFLSPPSLPPPGIYPAVGYCRPLDVPEATPPYFVGDRRLPSDVRRDRATTGLCGGGVYGNTRPRSGVLDDAGGDCPVRAVLLAGDTLRRTAGSALTPPPSVFAWPPTGFSSSVADHDPVCRFQSYYTDLTVNAPACRSPVGADRKSIYFVICHHHLFAQSTSNSHVQQCNIVEQDSKVQEWTLTAARKRSI